MAKAKSTGFGRNMARERETGQLGTKGSSETETSIANKLS